MYFVSKIRAYDKETKKNPQGNFWGEKFESFEDALQHCHDEKERFEEEAQRNGMTIGAKVLQVEGWKTREYNIIDPNFS